MLGLYIGYDKITKLIDNCISCIGFNTFRYEV